MTTTEPQAPTVQEWHRLRADSYDLREQAVHILAPAARPLTQRATFDEQRALLAGVEQAISHAYDRAFQAGRDSRGPVPDDARLWAVHHQGSDDIIAQPDRAAADRLIALLAEHDDQQAQRERPEVAVYHRAVLVEWPYTPQDHADALSRADSDG